MSKASLRVVAPEPTLDHARDTARQAEQAALAATSAVEAVLQRAPGNAIVDRRWFASMAPLTPRSENDFSLSADARAQIAHRREFDKAVAAEDDARRARDRARNELERLQKAADLAALGDGRAKLAERQIEASELEREIAATGTAHGKAEQAVFAMYRTIDDAEKAITEAKDNFVRHAIDAAMGAVDEAPKSLKVLRTELADAQEALEAAKSVRDGLNERLSQLSSSRFFRREKIDDAIRHVVRVHPAVTTLLKSFAAARQEYFHQQALVRLLSRQSMLPDGADVSERPPEQQDNPDLAKWSTAIEALKTDHLASLPDVRS